MLGGIVGVLEPGLLRTMPGVERNGQRPCLSSYELMNITAAREQVNRAFDRTGIDENQKAAWITRQLNAERPHLTPLFEPSLTRLMYVDDQLSTHLSLVRHVYSGVSRRLDVLIQADRTGHPRSLPNKSKSMRIGYTVGFSRPLTMHSALKCC